MAGQAFFQWISSKYPSIVEPCLKPKSRMTFSNRLSNNTNDANNMNSDSLYFDMDRLVQRSCQPADKPAPRNEEELLGSVFEYMDDVFEFVNPQRLVYMALSGVAANARMNQERARRFRIEKLQHQEGIITLGTDFVNHLVQGMTDYIKHRQRTDPAWARLTVIFSDADAPGEAEEKIMAYIRRQREEEDYDPDTYHCLHGAPGDETDLIMLGLSTHEFNVSIIQEQLSDNHQPEFVFLRLSQLRRHLSYELNMTGLPFPHDQERALDDWMLLSCFTGNDFLPPLPSLDAEHGGMEKLIMFYKKMVYQTNGYLTNRGILDMARVQLIFEQYATMEEDICKYRIEHNLTIEQFEDSRKKRQKTTAATTTARVAQKIRLHQMLGQLQTLEDKIKQKTMPSNDADVTPPRLEAEYRHLADPTEDFYQLYDIRLIENANRRISMVGRPLSNCEDHPKIMRNKPSELRSQQHKRKAEEIDIGSSFDDTVKRWQVDRREHHYPARFGLGANSEAYIRTLTKEYMQGVCLVVQYYRNGRCPFLTRPYPHKHAPLAADFVNIGSGLQTWSPDRSAQPNEPDRTTRPSVTNASHPPPRTLTGTRGSLPTAHLLSLLNVVDQKPLEPRPLASHQLEPRPLEPAHLSTTLPGVNHGYGVLPSDDSIDATNRNPAQSLLNDVGHTTRAGGFSLNVANNQLLVPRPLEPAHLGPAPPFVNQNGYGVLPFTDSVPRPLGPAHLGPAPPLVNQNGYGVNHQLLVPRPLGPAHLGPAPPFVNQNGYGVQPSTDSVDVTSSNQGQVMSYTTVAGRLRGAGGNGPLLDGWHRFSYPPPPY